MQDSDVHKFGDKGKMLIVIIKPLMLLTLSWTVTARLIQKQIIPVDTFFILWKINVCHHSDQSLMVTLSWVVVIHHTIFQMRPVYFWYIANKVKDWWLNIFTCLYTKLIYWLNMSFAHHICCFFVVCNHVNYFIDHISQLARFLTWHVLIFENSVK